jgi:hypothetical protein
VKRYYRTGEVAEFCGVCAHKVAEWIDGGLLKGYTVPGTRHRRVLPGDLLAFIRVHGLPMPNELASVPTTLPAPPPGTDMGGLSVAGLEAVVQLRTDGGVVYESLTAAQAMALGEALVIAGRQLAARQHAGQNGRGVRA